MWVRTATREAKSPLPPTSLLSLCHCYNSKGGMKGRWKTDPQPLYKLQTPLAGISNWPTVRLYLICAKDIMERDVLINLILTQGFSMQLFFFFFFPKHTFLKNQVFSLTLRRLSIWAVPLNCFFNIMATFKKFIQCL